MLMPDLSLSSENGHARRRKQLLALLKELRAVGAHTHLDLPRIVVIGNQSAGKSSLIEAISGIKVPRDAGTCTRCPMECRLLSSSGPWSCQVSIRWEYHPSGKRRSDVEEVPFGGILTEKAEVEMMLRRAQAAVLDPQIPTSQFLVMDAAELNALSPRDRPESTPFSRNVVCVDISGPDLTDLSFVDLPGIIQNADSHVVNFVEHMVRSYISGTCLIVVALPMSDDIENQRALRLAREADRDGSRTIGVMTKPDTLGSGSIKAKALWLDILEGRSPTHSLRHGYYCTRQPDDAERAAGITAAQAREAEARFFADSSPWNMSIEQQRFGTNNLVRYLSNMLTEIINGIIPRLQRDVDEKLAACYAELKTMPPPITGEPASFVLTLLSSFGVDVQTHVTGGARAEALVQQNRREYEKLKHAIRSTAPRFVPLVSAKDTPPDTEAAAISDVEEETAGATLQNGSDAGCMYLKDMRLHIQRSMTRELPFNVPYPAKTALINSFQTTWEQQCLGCFECIQRHFRSTLTQLLHARCGRFKNLEGKIDAAMMELLHARRDATRQQIEILLKFETTPFTQNTHYLSDVIAKTLARYKDVREGRIQHSVAANRSETPPGVEIHREVGNPFLQFVPEPRSSLASALPPSTPIPDKVDFSRAYASDEKPDEDETVSRPVATKKNRRKPRPTDWEESRVQTFPKEAPMTAFASPAARGVSEDIPAMALAELAGATTQASPFGANTSSTTGFKSGPFPGFTGFKTQPVQAASRTEFGALDFNQQQTSSVPVASENAERAQLEAEALSALARLGYVGLTADDLGKLNPTDEYEEELNVMAEVRAYFQVCYKRIIDYIPLAIDHIFLFAFAEALQMHLIQKLALGGSDAATRCAAYLSEDLDIVTRRQELTGKKTSLEKAKMELMSVSFDGVELSAPL